MVANFTANGQINAGADSIVNGAGRIDRLCKPIQAVVMGIKARAFIT